MLLTLSQGLLKAQTNYLSPSRPELFTPLELQKSLDLQKGLNLPDNPSFKFPGNKGLPTSNFLTKEQFLPSLNKKAVLKSFELMTFGEYVAKTPYADLPPNVSPERMVVVVKVEFPEKLEADNADYSPGATVISVRDALTKEPFGYSITGDIIQQKGVGAVIEPGKAAPSVQPAFCSDPNNKTKLECQQF